MSSPLHDPDLTPPHRRASDATLTTPYSAYRSDSDDTLHAFKGVLAGIGLSAWLWVIGFLILGWCH